MDRRLHRALWFLVLVLLAGALARGGEFHDVCWTYRGGYVHTGAIVSFARYGHFWRDAVWVSYPQNCVTIDPESLQPGLVFILVTTFNAAGESSTEHGVCPGAGWEPVP